MVQSWMDNTGLYQKYGVSRTTPTKAGSYRTVGELREVECVIDLTELTETETPISDVVFFPVGMKIEQIEIFVDTAAATGVAVDIGLVKSDRSTEIDFDGLVEAITTATLVAGAKLTLVSGDSFAGNLVGGTTADVGYITASRTTSTAFTTGQIRVRIKYSKA